MANTNDIVINSKKSSALRTVLRRYARADWSCPVVVVDGDSVPNYIGEYHYYTNISGDVINYPTAYSKKGFSSMRYHPSTLRVEVGIDWLYANGLCPDAVYYK